MSGRILNALFIVLWVMLFCLFGGMIARDYLQGEDHSFAIVLLGIGLMITGYTRAWLLMQGV